MSKKTNANIRRMITLSSIILLLGVFLFTWAINVSKFKEDYLDSYFSSYQVLENSFVRNMEYSLKYGRSLDHFYGMQDTLREMKKEVSSIEEALIILEDGTVAYSLSGERVGKPTTLEPASFAPLQENPSLNGIYLAEQDKYHSIVPILDREERLAGYLDLIVPASAVSLDLDPYLKQILFYLALFLFIATTALIIAFGRVSVLDGTGQIKVKTFLIVTILVTGVAQLAFGLANFFMFKNIYTDISVKNTTQLVQLVKKDIDSVVAKGVPLAQLTGVDDWLEEIRSSTPEIQDIYIFMDEEASPSREKLNGTASFSVPLAGTSQSAQGYLRAELKADLSMDYINRKVADLLLDALTIMITSVMYMIELTIFLMLLIRQRLEKNQLSQASSSKIDSNTLRALSFIYYLAYALSMAIVVLYMSSLYRPFLGLPKNVAIALPISLEMLLSIPASAASGWLIQRMGIRNTLLLGVGAIASGSLLSFAIPDALVFILARGITGLGNGLMLTTIKSFAAYGETDQEKSSILAASNAGGFAAMNCGAVIGAMIADALGYQRVFLLSAFLCLLPIFYILYFSNNIEAPFREKGQVAMLTKKPNKRSVRWAFLQYLGNFSVVTYFLLILIPFIMADMLLDYYFPLFATDQGLSATNVGRAFLVNSLFVVYLGPLFSRLSSKYMSAKRAVVLASLLSFLSVLLFGIPDQIATAFLAIALLGVAASIGSSAQYTYLLSLEASKGFGEYNAIVANSIIIKVGQILGPLLIGAVVTGASSAESFIYLGGAMLALILVFNLITGKSSVPAQKEPPSMPG